MMIKVSNLSFSYRKPHVQLFNNFSLDLEPGCTYGLLGKNGAGKSTLVYLMAGLLTPTSGEVLFHDTNVRRRLPITTSDMFLIPEEFQLPDTSLSDFVRLNAPFYPKFSHEDLQRYLAVFEMESAMRLKSLSMGQKKKVYMAFALATNTGVLIMDEPTNGLDIPSKSQFRKAIAQSMTPEKTILISTHQVRDVDAIFDHILIIDRSKVLLSASVSEISRRLSFKVNGDASKALYVRPGINGQVVMEQNLDGEETIIDVEMLFNATVSAPEEINQIFNPSK